MCGQDLREEVGGSNFVGFSARPGRLETARFPGCLTSESEERETWTAESLRTAPRVRRLELHSFGLFLEESGHGRDFGGRRFRSTLTVRFGEQLSEWADSGTSSKRVISRNQLIQLESLILAQSERWRQA